MATQSTARGYRTRSWVFTIYPQLSDDIPWDPTTIDWSASTPAVSYVLCQLEECPTTNKIHWQGTLELEYPNLLKAAQKALSAPGCHLEKRKGSLQQSIDYCTKSQSRISDVEVFVYGIPTSVRPTRNEIYQAALSSDTWIEAAEYLQQHDTANYVIHKRAIDTSIKELYNERKPLYPKVPTAISFSKHKIPDTILQERSAYIWGASGLGKTYWAIHHFDRPLLVRHIDDLKGLSDRNDGIIFDDMSFSHWPRSACIHILDVKLQTTVNVKHSVVTIKAGTRRIFTSNLPFGNSFNFTDNGVTEKIALERRCKRWRISGSLIYEQYNYEM